MLIDKTKKHQKTKSRLKSKAIQSSHSKLKPKLNNHLWLTVSLLILIGLAAMLMVHSIKVYQSLKVNQVHLFVHQEDNNHLSLDGLLIRSAVVNQPHQLIFFTQPQLFQSKSFSYNAVKLAVADFLKVPIDQVYILPKQVNSKLGLIKQVLILTNHSRKQLVWLIAKGDLLHLILTAKESKLDINQSLDDISNTYLERSMIQNNKVCSIAVINTTNINGLASKVGQLLEKNGVYIVRVTSNDQSLPASYVMVDESKPDCTLVAQKLEGLLPGNKPMVTGPALDQYRADVVVFLGKNLGDFGYANIEVSK